MVHVAINGMLTQILYTLPYVIGKPFLQTFHMEKLYNEPQIYYPPYILALVEPTPRIHIKILMEQATMSV